jgi:hypothetical protein
MQEELEGGAAAAANCTGGWRWPAVAPKGEKSENDDDKGFIAKARQRGSDTRWTTAHAEQEVVTAGAPRSGSKITDDGGRWLHAVG